MTYRLTAILLLAGGLAAGVTGVATTAQQPAASASAYAISVVVPGQAGGSAGGVSAPGGGATSVGNGFAYPADGSIVSAGPLSSSASANAADAGASGAVTDVLGVSLFNGEITFDSAAGRATSSSAVADTTGSTVVNLLVAGQAVGATPNQRVALGDWGSLVTLEGATARTTGSTIDARATVTAVRVTLIAEHGGLPAGSEILIGHAETASSVPAPEEAPATTTVTTTTTATTPATPPAPPKPRPAAIPPAQGKKKLPEAPEPDKDPVPKVRTAPTEISAPLSPGGFVFPVYGPSSFSDTYGAARAVVTWHHGEDVFAPLGAPILAVADGTVFSVGWNDIGGYRFWLRDRAGNQFYYAHLSAFSPLAVNGREVKAGQVIGFIGNTGDAQGTPYHLHFEIHPVALLPLGYDGVINPYEYLTAWRRLVDVSFAAGRGWAPPVPAAASAPRPGAFLLGSTDISSASGLDPGSLERALVAPVSAESDGALIRSG